MNPNQPIAGRDCAPVDHLLRRHDADDKSGRIVLAVGIHAGHLSRFAANQRQAIFATSRGHSRHQPFERVRFEHAHRDIVEEEEWTGATGEDVVRAVIDEIGADPEMRFPTAHERQFQFRPDAIGARDQQAIRAARQLVHPAEVTDRRGTGIAEG
ncbi:MAG: hypothetical protein R2845_02410 [Thermomicrobiales bacterium]